MDNVSSKFDKRVGGFGQLQRVRKPNTCKIHGNLSDRVLSLTFIQNLYFTGILVCPYFEMDSRIKANVKVRKFIKLNSNLLYRNI